MLTVADDNLSNTNFPRPAECLMQDCVSFFSAFLGLEEIRPVEELRIDLFQINEVGDVNGMRGLDSDLFKVLILQHNIMTALIFEAFYDLIAGDFLRVGFRHLFISNGAEIARTKLSKAKLFLARGRINRHRDINQPEADTALPDGSHMGFKECFFHSWLPLSITDAPNTALRNCLATSWNDLILRAAYVLPRQLHELGRARLNCHSADYSGFVRSKETAGTRPRNGPGS